MAKLYFKFGCMGASKTAEALMTRYRYEQIGKNWLFAKTSLETRDGARVIKSRIGLSYDNVLYLDEVLGMADYSDYDCIIVDEAQFSTKEQIDQLSFIVDAFDIPVICYGLKTDFKGEFFEGSKRLFEIADKLCEIKQICWCGRKAIFNAKIVNGRMVTQGEQIDIGGDEKYVALCRKHYNLRDFKPSNEDEKLSSKSDWVTFMKKKDLQNKMISLRNQMKED